MLSAGYFGFYAHAGVLIALEERGLRPSRVIGTSAGAIAGGVFCAGLSAKAVGEAMLAVERQDFWDPALVPAGGLLAGRKFGAKLRTILEPTGVSRIERCPLRFSAVTYDAVRRETVVLDAGPLEPAIRASCALPGLFRPVPVEGRLLLDGGILDRPGLRALDPVDGEFVVYHHIPARSRWSKDKPDLKPEQTEQRWVHEVPESPRPGPFKMRIGPTALSIARGLTHAWLDEVPEVGG